jgi:S1-C subfamily serine protease
MPVLLLTVHLIIQAATATPLVPSPTDYLNAEKTYFIENEKNTMEVFSEAAPLVVSVDSTRMSHFFFSSQQQEVPAGSGSGFIWDDKGHIITNFHVIGSALNSASQIWVTTQDGTRLQATVVGSEPAKDIAVLRVKGLSGQSAGFTTKVAASDELRVGQKVLAIGSPFGFEHSLTTGIVSGLNRSMPSVLSSVTIRDMIQTDASINPGNSGGPLLDSRGHLIGMSTSIVSGSGSSAGIGFAVPSNAIKRIANQIITYGEVRQAGLGVVPLSPFRKRLLGRYGYDVQGGVVIESVAPGSPAARAGLRGIEEHSKLGVRIGDIIVQIDKIKIENFDDLYNALSEKRVGDQVKVQIRRMGRTLTKTVALDLIEKQS